jgi:hypothetical protein
MVTQRILVTARYSRHTEGTRISLGERRETLKGVFRCSIPRHAPNIAEGVSDFWRRQRNMPSDQDAFETTVSRGEDEE